MSIVIDSRIADETMLYSSMEQPENDTLGSQDSANSDASSNELMEDQMSSSHDHLEAGPQKPQHIIVLDRSSSLGKRDHPSILVRTPSQSSILGVDLDPDASPRARGHNGLHVYSKKKQKISARQRKRQLERKFGTDFRPGTIRHRLNFLQHSFGDQLALIEESLPKTFFRVMSLETFIKNKMEQHALDETAGSFRRSPESRRKYAMETHQMSEIISSSPLEMHRFEPSSPDTPARVVHIKHRSASPLTGSQFTPDENVMNFLNESPPPSPTSSEDGERVPTDAIPALPSTETPMLVWEHDPHNPAGATFAAVCAPSDAPATVTKISSTGIMEDMVRSPKSEKNTAIPEQDAPYLPELESQEEGEGSDHSEVVGDEMQVDGEEEVSVVSESAASEPSNDNEIEGVVDEPVTMPDEGAVDQVATVSPQTEQVSDEEPVSVLVMESASQIPEFIQDAPSRESSMPGPEESVKLAPKAVPGELEKPCLKDGVVVDTEPVTVETAPASPKGDPPVVVNMAIDTDAAPTDDLAVPSTPVGDQQVPPAASSACFESPRPMDAVERARMEQSTPLKAQPSAPDATTAPTSPTLDAVEVARSEQRTPIKGKPAENDPAAHDAAKQPKAETTTTRGYGDVAIENKENDISACTSPNSVMNTELSEKEEKVEKQIALKENRKIRFADEEGQPLTKEYLLQQEADYASRIVVMLLSPRDRKFEFLHAEYPADESTTVQVLLEQIPSLATNEAFRTKTFNALLQTETSRQLDNNLALQDYSFKESEIVLGIPDDFTVGNMTKMAVPLLLNKKLMRTVKQAIRKGRGLKTVQSGEEWKSKK